MPMLDVSWVVMDPMLVDKFDLTRRAETMNLHGRPTMTSVTTPDLLGVVTQADPSTLSRADDSQTVPRVISVVSKFAFRGSSQGYQPDLIIWNGTSYLVTNVSPYNRFGAGFYEATASSMTGTDTAQ